MKLFLDSYYYYSWMRLYTAEVKELVKREKKRRNIDQVLFFENLQLPIFPVQKLEDKIVTVLQHRIVKKIMDELYDQVVIRKSKRRISLLELHSRGISDEHIPIIEYLLLADDSGRVEEGVIHESAEIRINDTVRRRVSNINKLSYPQVNPIKFRDYLITRVARVLNMKIVREQAPKELILRYEDLINQAEAELCGSDEARMGCEVVRRSNSIRNHTEDVRLALALATYVTRVEPLVVVPKLPANYECFQHMLDYIRQKIRLENKLVVLKD